MAIVSNTFLTYSAKGIREDLSNIITNIAPEETPYLSNIGSESISNSLFEWQTDTLASAAANKLSRKLKRSQPIELTLLTRIIGSTAVDP